MDNLKDKIVKDTSMTEEKTKKFDKNSLYEISSKALHITSMVSSIALTVYSFYKKVKEK